MSYLPPTNTTSTNTTGNPLQPTYLGAPPQVAPTTSNVNTSAQPAIAQLNSANALTNAQQNNNLSNLLASEGISGNDATAAQGALSGQLTAAEAPSLASLIQSQNNNALGQSEFNASAGNTASGQNLAAILGTNSQNVGAANNASTDLASLLQQNYGLDLNAVLGILGGGQSGGNAVNSTGLSNQLGLNNSTANAQNQTTTNNWNDLALAFGA
jgi:hypothetical protein